MTPSSIGKFAESVLMARHDLGTQYAQGARRANGSVDILESDELTQTQVYIGLNDSETKHQKFDTSRYIELLKRVCVSYGTPFSFDVVSGGYIHDDGQYTEENTIVLTFIDVDQNIIDEIAQDLRTFFHQESILITTSPIRLRMIREEPSGAEQSE